jgi:hypothetical protein
MEKTNPEIDAQNTNTAIQSSEENVSSLVLSYSPRATTSSKREYAQFQMSRSSEIPEAIVDRRAAVLYAQVCNN